MTVRKYEEKDIPGMVRVWNEVVEDGIAFPQVDLLTEETGRAFFAKQSHCGVAVEDNGEVLAMYILHPNNVGRCGHISFMGPDLMSGPLFCFKKLFIDYLCLCVVV